MVNYRFWQNYADCERDKLTVDAHKAIYDGKQAYAQGEISNSEAADRSLQPSKAQLLFTEGMTKLEQVFSNYPQLVDHDAYIEEAMLAGYYLEKIYQYNGQKPPDEFPLKNLIIQNMGRQIDIERQFILENRPEF